MKGRGAAPPRPPPNVEFGAVNCVAESRICSEWFGIRSYPTYLALSDVHGTRQEFLGTKDDVSAVVDWALMVAREWSWLFARSELVVFKSPKHFRTELLRPPSSGKENDYPFWVVMFTDGVDCQACKTAKTNLMRLAASLHDVPARVGLVDCEEDAHREWCYGHGACLSPSSPPSSTSLDSTLLLKDLPCHELPERPHAPVRRFWVRRFWV